MAPEAGPGLAPAGLGPFASAPGSGERGGELTIVAHDIGSVRGGMERQLTELLEGLRGHGYRITVIARTCELPDSSGVTFHRVRGPGRPFLIAYPWFLLAGSLALRRWRRGLVQATGAIVLNHVEVVAVHYCQQVGTATPSRPNWLFRAHITLSGGLKRIGERVCFRASRAAAFVCVSEGVAEEVRAHYPDLAERVVTIYNGIDTATFAPAEADEKAAARAALGVHGDRPLAAFVGSEWERKGLEPAIRAVALAREWDLLVAGAGDQVRYRRLAEELGVAGQVHWLGPVEHVQRVYRAADAFLLPSSYETFSLVSFEAAASGLAVLATPVNGVRELITDDRNGFLISRDPELIAERLRRLLDPRLRARLGAQARSSALGFSSERMVAAHAALYASLSVSRAPR